jgi:hypothetical protein
MHHFNVCVAICSLTCRGNTLTNPLFQMKAVDFNGNANFGDEVTKWDGPRRHGYGARGHSMRRMSLPSRRRGITDLAASRLRLRHAYPISQSTTRRRLPQTNGRSRHRSSCCNPYQIPLINLSRHASHVRPVPAASAARPPDHGRRTHRKRVAIQRLASVRRPRKSRGSAN